jgi:hypothetical protein
MKKFQQYLILIITFAIYTGTIVGMEDERQQGKEKKQQKKGKEKGKKKSLKKRFVQKVKKAVLGKAPIEPFNFPELPKDLQYSIIHQLTLFISSNDIFTATQSINALSLVNTDLYALFSDHNFIVELINTLALNFGIWKETVASLLSSPAAKQYLQERLKIIGTTEEKDLFLLQDDSVNINIPIDDNGNTALMLSIQSLNKPKITALLDNKRLNINKQNNEGNTALHLVLLKILETTDNDQLKLLKHIALDIIRIKHASLKIRNNNGFSPNYFLSQITDEDFLNKIRRYIFRQQGI